jgi:hypothetical protein
MSADLSGFPVYNSVVDEGFWDRRLEGENIGTIFYVVLPNIILPGTI